MKKYMKVIFIIAVLFIISVGLFGVIRGNHKLNNNVSYNNLRKDEEHEIEDAAQKVQSKTEESPKASETTEVKNELTDSQDVSESTESQQNQINDEEEQGTEKSEKEQYITRLNSIMTYYEDMWKKSESDMTSMKELQNQEYTKWDDELNTIYQLIKKKLPEDEFVTIREEEREWIKDRDEKSELAASKYAGGTMEGLEYMAVMTDLTRERTYELVEIYFEE